MVLVGISAMVGENQAWRNLLFECFKHVFYFTSEKRQETVSEALETRAAEATACKQFGCATSFGFTLSGCTKHHPMEYGVRILFG